MEDQGENSYSRGVDGYEDGGDIDANWVKRKRKSKNKEEYE